AAGRRSSGRWPSGARRHCCRRRRRSVATTGPGRQIRPREPALRAWKMYADDDAEDSAAVSRLSRFSPRRSAWPHEIALRNTAQLVDGAKDRGEGVRVEQAVLLGQVGLLEQLEDGVPGVVLQADRRPEGPHVVDVCARAVRRDVEAEAVSR